ncbi:hypothetical protein RB595_000457 [Gaeumannomyces hyphopodioides]
MISRSYLIRLLAVIAVANALPLNINLGAYSPAVVVGDGAIEFEGGPGVEKIMNTLQGAGVSGAARAAAASTGAPAREVVAAPASAPQGATQASVSSGILNEQASLPIPGSNKELDPRDEPEAEDDDEEGEVEATADNDDDDEEEADEQTGAAAKVQKRQGGAGFDRALTYAEAALTKGPKINLGTHVSGVGILVDNNPTVAARPGTGAAEEH